MKFSAFVLVVVMVGRAVSPIFADVTTYGGHDWDEILVHRLLVTQSLRDYHQFPGWNPYACGGYSEWANPQGAAVLVSPLFPLYLFLDARLALRLEVVFTALVAASGTWLWAARYVKSPALCVFACVAFVVNGRWALQSASGHVMHSYYALVPWVFFFFDRAFEKYRAPQLGLSNFVGAAAGLALMVYSGAIYPLPQTALLLGVYALVHALTMRSFKPFVVLAGVGFLGFALAAPKLLPVLREMARFPRKIDSPETMDLNALLQALLARGQVMGSRPAHVQHWGWHEYGMYVGAGVLVPVLVAALAPSDRRERALRWTAGVALVLALGAFHRFAPWSLLHELPVFGSQHVPSRWLYPAALFYGVLAATVGERWLSKLGRRRLRLPAELVLLVPVALLALDVSAQSAAVMRSAFWMRMHEIPKFQVWKQHKLVPPELHYVHRDYGPPAAPAVLARAGVIECGTLHFDLGVWGPKKNGRSVGQGARGHEEPDYRGEAFIASGFGKASIVEFSPNAVTVEVIGAKTGDTLVLNQNFAEGWRADGRQVFSYDDRLATRLEHPSGRVRFSYTPPLLWLGVSVAAAAILLVAVLGRRNARKIATRQIAEREASRLL